MCLQTFREMAVRGNTTIRNVWRHITAQYHIPEEPNHKCQYSRSINKGSMLCRNVAIQVDMTRNSTTSCHCKRLNKQHQTQFMTDAPQGPYLTCHPKKHWVKPVRVAKQKATSRNSPSHALLAACYKNETQNRCLPRLAFNLLSASDFLLHSNLPVINSWAKSITAYVKKREVEEQVDTMVPACVSGVRDGGDFVKRTEWQGQSKIHRFHCSVITVF